MGLTLALSLLLLALALPQHAAALKPIKGKSLHLLAPDGIYEPAPPQTTIGSGPTGTIADNTPTFTFSSIDPTAAFECRFDIDAFGTCSGPDDSHTPTSPLADGDHTFEVRSVDSFGNPDPTPASRSFTVDTTGPETTIAKRPKGKVKTRKRKVKVKVVFGSEAGATHRCKMDKAKYKRCSSPYSVKAKAKGGKGKKHTIKVKATDGVGNSGTPALVKFKAVRDRPLQASAANRTIARALKRHDFSRRVVKSVQSDCDRSNRYAFKCRFSSRFPGYRLKGHGRVKKLRKSISYRFRVKAQGVRFTLTDENE